MKSNIYLKFITNGIKENLKINMDQKLYNFIKIFFFKFYNYIYFFFNKIILFKLIYSSMYLGLINKFSTYKFNKFFIGLYSKRIIYDLLIMLNIFKQFLFFLFKINKRGGNILFISKSLFPSVLFEFMSTFKQSLILGIGTGGLLTNKRRFNNKLRKVNSKLYPRNLSLYSQYRILSCERIVYNKIFRNMYFKNYVFPDCIILFDLNSYIYFEATFLNIPILGFLTNIDNLGGITYPLFLNTKSIYSLYLLLYFLNFVIQFSLVYNFINYKLILFDNFFFEKKNYIKRLYNLNYKVFLSNKYLFQKFFKKLVLKKKKYYLRKNSFYFFPFFIKLKKRLVTNYSFFFFKKKNNFKKKLKVYILSKYLLYMGIFFSDIIHKHHSFFYNFLIRQVKIFQKSNIFKSSKKQFYKKKNKKKNFKLKFLYKNPTEEPFLFYPVFLFVWYNYIVYKTRNLISTIQEIQKIKYKKLKKKIKYKKIKKKELRLFNFNYKFDSKQWFNLFNFMYFSPYGKSEIKVKQIKRKKKLKKYICRRRKYLKKELLQINSSNFIKLKLQKKKKKIIKIKYLLLIFFKNLNFYDKLNYFILFYFFNLKVNFFFKFKKIYNLINKIIKDLDFFFYFNIMIKKNDFFFKIKKLYIYLKLLKIFKKLNKKEKIHDKKLLKLFLSFNNLLIFKKFLIIFCKISGKKELKLNINKFLKYNLFLNKKNLYIFNFNLYNDLFKNIIKMNFLNSNIDILTLFLIKNRLIKKKRKKKVYLI